jgi:hypothetical protein
VVRMLDFSWTRSVEEQVFEFGDSKKRSLTCTLI